MGWGMVIVHMCVRSFICTYDESPFYFTRREKKGKRGRLERRVLGQQSISGKGASSYLLRKIEEG